MAQRKYLVNPGYEDGYDFCNFLIIEWYFTVHTDASETGSRSALSQSLCHAQREAACPIL